MNYAAQDTARQLENIMIDANYPAAFIKRTLFMEPLARYTSWKVGGPAERFFQPLDKTDLINFLRMLPETESLFWMGLGSNLLIRDGGISGTVINTRGRLKAMRMQEQTKIYVEAGVPCAHVARFCCEQDLVGAEFFAGIPGTMGGALAMNAGAFGGETWALVDKVYTVNRTGISAVRPRHEYKIGYRSVTATNQDWFLATTLRLKPGDGRAGKEKIRRLLAQRAQTQPTNLPSCGSVFRNPPDDHAARLIEDCGLKGFSVGSACVSDKHANFIVNSGGATAADIEALIEYIKGVVFDRQKIVLIPEVRIVGEREKPGNHTDG